MLKVTPGAREAIIKYVTTIIGDGAATKVVTMVEKTLLQQWYHKKSMSYEPERVGFQVLSLRQFDPIEHSPRPDLGLKHQGTARFWHRALDCGPGNVGSAHSLAALFLWNFGLSGWWYGFLKS